MFFYAQQQSDKQLEANFDKDQYDEAELVTIKVPLSLPYQTDQADFQRVDGEITFNGKIYKYVKRKIADGNLVLMCLPNYNKMRLKKEKDDFFKEANSLGENTGTKKQENSKGNFYKNIVAEFDKIDYTSSAILDQRLSHGFSQHKFPLLTMPHSSPEQPPERASGAFIITI
jgi:hypothetical protein